MGEGEKSFSFVVVPSDTSVSTNFARRPLFDRYVLTVIQIGESVFLESLQRLDVFEQTETHHQRFVSEKVGFDEFDDRWPVVGRNRRDFVGTLGAVRSNHFLRTANRFAAIHVARIYALTSSVPLRGGRRIRGGFTI